MLYFYAAFTSCYPPPGSSAGESGADSFRGDVAGPAAENATGGGTLGIYVPWNGGSTFFMGYVVNGA